MWNGGRNLISNKLLHCLEIVLNIKGKIIFYTYSIFIWKITSNYVNVILDSTQNISVTMREYYVCTKPETSFDLHKYKTRHREFVLNIYYYYSVSFFKIWFTRKKIKHYTNYLFGTSKFTFQRIYLRIV